MLQENLIMLRSLAGKTQEDIAEVIGISRQAYAKWERGETIPDRILWRDDGFLNKGRCAA